MLQRMNEFTKKFSDISGDYISKDTVNVKDMLDSQPRELKEYVNNTLIPQIETELATKEEIQNVILGQIPDGSITDAKLSADLGSFQTASGTATAIILTGIKFVNGYSKTFIVSANNNNSATTVNGKPLYKPNTTNAPNLIAGKAVTVWYNSYNDCFFIKASAEGNAVAVDVLAGKTFSNDNDTALIGTLDLSNLTANNIRKNITINGVTGTILDANITVAGDIVQMNNSNQVSTTQPTTAVKMKESTINLTGSIRVKFDLSVGPGGQTAYGQVYKNDIPVGALRSTTNGSSYTTFTEDFTCVAGDKFQLYMYRGNGASVALNINFMICNSNPILAT